MRPNTADGNTTYSDPTHDYLCTRCKSRGGVCLEALWLAQRVARGLAARAADLPEAFELTSETEFRGCGQACRVRLHVAGTTVDVACNLPDDGAKTTAAARVVAAAQAPRALAVGA